MWLSLSAASQILVSVRITSIEQNISVDQFEQIYLMSFNRMIKYTYQRRWCEGGWAGWTWRHSSNRHHDITSFIDNRGRALRSGMNEKMNKNDQMESHHKTNLAGARRTLTHAKTNKSVT
jgi:hypothetical protein